VLEGNNPRFPWQPPATMLTYRLTGTTELTVSTGTDRPILAGPHRHDQPTADTAPDHRIFASPGEPS